MQISSRFTIATHMLVFWLWKEKTRKLTSDILAGSISVKSVNIQLRPYPSSKNTGIITVARWDRRAGC